MPSQPRHRLDALFSPTSVAIVGASPKRTQGVNVVLNLRATGYQGAVYPVHPSAGEFMGLQAHASIAQLPEVPDCAVFALGSDKLVPEFEKAAQAGVKAAVVFASGFGELDAEGAAREARLQHIARQHGMVLCGPNCMGLVDLHSRFAGYSVPIPRGHQRPGGVAILSHSGAGCVVLGNTGRLGLRCIVSSGNSSVTDLPDYLDYLAEDERTSVAVLLLETVRDPAAFLRAARRMHAAGKSVVALKNGRSAKGAAATAAHTGAVAGSYAVYQDLFAQCGVIAVDDLDELVETTVLLEALGARRPRGGVGLISISGGEISMACDIAAQAGVELPELDAAVSRRIEASMPQFAFASNPLDARTLAPEVYANLAEGMASDAAVSLLVAAQDSSDTLTDTQAQTYRGISQGLAMAAARTDKPVVFYNNVAAPVHAQIAAPLEEAGIPMLRGARNALLAIGRVLNRPVPDAPAPAHASVPRDPRWVERLAAPQPLSESEAKAFLASCGVRVPREQLAPTAAQAGEAAQRIGFPVVLKIDSPDIAHKTELGAVRLGLQSAQEAEAAGAAILAAVAQHAPGARVRGVCVQEMVQGGIETLLGLSRHGPFGLALTVGWGGVQVELMRDAQVLLLPCDGSRALQALGRTRVGALLDGYRGMPGGDKPALVELMLRLSAIAETYGDLLEAVDLNPVAALPRGQGCVVLDALVVTRAQAAGAIASKSP